MTTRTLAAIVLLLGTGACAAGPPPSGVVTLAVLSSPNSLDPRVGSDETSQRAPLTYDLFCAACCSTTATS